MYGGMNKRDERVNGSDQNPDIWRNTSPNLSATVTTSGTIAADSNGNMFLMF